MLSHLSWPHRLTTSTVQFVTTSLSHGPSEESGIEPEPIATITGSFVSNPDTDRTDLVSEIDEAEIRRQLLRDQWRQFFDKFDPEGFGEIPWPEFLNVLNKPEFRQRVDSGKREIFFEKARSASTPAITYQDFVNVGVNVEHVPIYGRWFLPQRHTAVEIEYPDSVLTVSSRNTWKYHL